MTKTKIAVSTQTREDLKQLGRKADTYDDVIRHLIMLYREMNGQVPGE